MTARSYDWNEDSQLTVLPTSHPSLSEASVDLATSVRRAIEASRTNPPPTHISIVTNHRTIEFKEIEDMFKDRTFPL